MLVHWPAIYKVHEDPEKLSGSLAVNELRCTCMGRGGMLEFAPNMVPVAQWQSASLWMKMLRVRTPSGTQGTSQGVFFCLTRSVSCEII